MISIIKANKDDPQLLSEIATRTFIESHGNCAKPEDVRFYIAEKYGATIFEKELMNEKNNYYLIYHNNQVAGYSNLILNSPYEGSEMENVAKLERIYLLEEFYDLKLGLTLFEFNVGLAKQNNQKGIWLFVWKENHRAIRFYTKNGFTIIGSYDFKISETHSNPNHQLFLPL